MDLNKIICKFKGKNAEFMGSGSVIQRQKVQGLKYRLMLWNRNAIKIQVIMIALVVCGP